MPVGTTTQNTNTYTAGVTGLVTVSGATDVFRIAGAAGTVIRLTKVSVSGTMAANSYVDISLVKHSTLDTGGTSSAIVPVPFDSRIPASAATVTSYTGNPTVGNFAFKGQGSTTQSTNGVIATTKYFAPISSNTTAQAIGLPWIWNQDSGSAPTLVSATEEFAISFNTGPAQAGSFDIVIEWTEGPTGS